MNLITLMRRASSDFSHLARSIMKGASGPVAKVMHCVFCSSLRVLSHTGLKDIPAGPITGKGNLRGNLIDCGGGQVNSVLKKEKCREIDDREVLWDASGQSLRAPHNKGTRLDSE